MVNRMKPSAAPDQPVFATYREFANASRLSESMVRKLVYAKKLKVVRFGKSARIPLSELDRIAQAEG